MGQSDNEQSQFWFYVIYPIVIIARMARYIKAQMRFLIQTGTIPVVDNIIEEVIGWTSFLLPILGMILFGCFAWLLLPFAYIIVPYIMKDPIENRASRRKKGKLKTLGEFPMVVIDARKVSVSHYMVDAPWAFVFCRTARWWHSFYQAMKAVHNVVFIPLRWSQKWAILWPPPGIITSLLFLLFIFLVHSAIFVRLFFVLE